MRFLLAALLALAGVTSSFADTVFVAHTSAPAAELSRQDIENVFLEKKTRWPGGGVIKVALLADEGRDFLNGLLGKSPEQLTTVWKKLVFTGQGVMPKIFKTEDELLAYVAATPGACGYATAGKGGAKVKEIPAP